MDIGQEYIEADGIMRTKLDCIHCFQRQALTASRHITNDEQVQERILRKVMEKRYWMEWTNTPPETARMVHQIVKEECDCKDPYKDIKQEYNKIALKLVPEIQQLIDGSANRLRTALLLSIAGNIIDFGALDNFDLEKTMKDVMREDLAIDDSERLLQELEKASSILYIADNTGEIVFDKVLLELVLREFGPKSILFAIKGGPIINDATREDAVFIGLDTIPGLELLEVSIGEPGTGVERTGKDFRKLIQNSDVTISKGQGNYEALSESGGIFFLLMAKCPVVADDIGVDVGSFILKEVKK